VLRPHGASVPDEAVATDPLEPLSEPEDRIAFIADKRGGISMRVLGALIGLLLVVDLLAVLLVPPTNKSDPGADCAYPVCYVNGTLHIPRPHEVWVAGGEEPATGLMTFQVSLTDTLFTMIIITIVVLLLSAAVTRRGKAVPGFFQNFSEWAYESLSNWGIGMGGSRAARYMPIFAASFILILAFNWSGLIPGIGILPWTRAPTSDLNVTIGLALFAFGYFEYQGFRRLGTRGYLSKFFPFYEFKKGIGAGLIALFVGLVELILEFVKPVTLSMRLFGNIFGGEVALAVVTGLTLALIPVALYGLEIILTFVQALIFSTLTLMFILAAVESHHHEEGHAGEGAIDALEGSTRHAAATT
jgi:F-type H+-transporting ATPase subunit a